MSEKIIQKKGRDIPQDEWDAMFSPTKKVIHIDVGDMSKEETEATMRTMMKSFNVDADDEKIIAVYDSDPDAADELHLKH